MGAGLHLLSLAYAGTVAHASLAGMTDPNTPPADASDPRARDLAEIPAVEVITRAAAMLMSAAAEKIGLSSPAPDASEHRDLDGEVTIDRTGVRRDGDRDRGRGNLIGDRDFDKNGIGLVDVDRYRDRRDDRWRYHRYHDNWWYWMPAGAKGPVSGTTAPMTISSDALALRISAGIASAPAVPIMKLRRDSLVIEAPQREIFLKSASGGCGFSE